MKRCNIGGSYWYPEIPGPAVYEERCQGVPTHRYRSPGMVEGHWQYRCARHVKILDAPGVTVEPL